MIWAMLGKKVVRVHQVDGPTIEGILVSKAGRHLQLVGARVLESADSSYTLDGTVTIPRERVAFWQETLT